MSIVSLQKKIGVAADGAFGPNTIKAAAKHYDLTTVQAVHFFAQTAHESGNFRAFSENLNYSDTALRAVFSKYFKTDEEAQKHARKPEEIANIVYANRMGNGDADSGDGWKYRGRGALQLTGKNNYEAFAEYVGDPSIVENPDVVADEFAFESAMFFFDNNKLWDICTDVSEETITKLTKRINGGTHGLEDRIEKTKKFHDWLK